MGKHEQEPATPKNSRDHDDDLDRMLDSALAKYAAVEPRAGLQERILARLYYESPQVVRTWWRWGLAFAVTAIAVAAVGLALRPATHSEPVVKNFPSITAPKITIPQNRETKKPEVQTANEIPSTAEQRHGESAHKDRPQFTRTEVAVTPVPRLEHFPSVQTPSPEVAAMVQYAKQFPQDALVIAQAQEEFEAEIQQDMQSDATQTKPSNSDRQER
jgi:hypothetical protein